MITEPPESWAAFLTQIGIAILIAFGRISAWRSARERKVIITTLNQVHTLVNGQSEKDARYILQLTQRVHDANPNAHTEAAIVAAQQVLDDILADKEKRNAVTTSVTQPP